MVKKVFVFVCLSLLVATAMAANITTRVDRDPVRLNESFKIIFEVDDNISANPDFSALERDFDILSRSRSSNMQIQDGDITQQTRWTLFVMAKHSGGLTIPSVQIGSGRSPQISVTVKEAGNGSAAAENKDMFLEVEAHPTSTYVQSQILYSIRFYRAVNVNSARMSEPSFSGAEVLVQRLGDDTTFEIQRNGRHYRVIERRYALFPQQSGNITIDPATLDAQMITTRPGVFDPFGQNTATRRLKSRSIDLDVKSIPANMQNQPWLPAEEVSLTESWSQEPPQFVVGEPVTRTLTLKAEGLSAAQLPPLTMQDDDGFRTYPDQPRLNDKRSGKGVKGTRQEKIALIPTRTGDLILPEIEIPWWNINTQQREVTRLPARTVQVRPGAGSTRQAPATTASPSSSAAPGAKTETTKPRAETTVIEKTQAGIYLWLSLFLGLAWLATAIGWAISQRRTQPPHRHSRTPAATASLNTVKKACQANEPQLAKDALLKWAEGFWPDNPPVSLGGIGQRLGDETQGEIEKLNRILYGSESAAWQGESLWQALARATINQPQREADRKQSLPPLYP